MWLPITPHLLVQIVRFELTRLMTRVLEALASTNSAISACLLSTPERRHDTLLSLPYTLEQLLPPLKSVIFFRRSKDFSFQSADCGRLLFLLVTVSLVEETGLEPARKLIQRILMVLNIGTAPI